MKLWKKIKFHKVKLLKFKTFNFDLKFLWNWSFFHYEKIMRFKKSPQQPGAGRTRAWRHHGSDRPTSPRAILHHTDQNAPNISGGSVYEYIFFISESIWFMELFVNSAPKLRVLQWVEVPSLNTCGKMEPSTKNQRICQPLKYVFLAASWRLAISRNRYSWWSLTNWKPIQSCFYIFFST